MASQRPADQKPFMPADAYGKSLTGLSLNFLVKNVARSVAFQREVLGATPIYVDPDFAVMQWRDGQAHAEWCLHADHTYGDHPLLGLTGDGALRGAGMEIRLHRCDPDAAVARAKARGDAVLADATDKPHGLREAYIADPDGYIWVPDIPLP